VQLLAFLLQLEGRREAGNKRGSRDDLMKEALGSDDTNPPVAPTPAEEAKALEGEQPLGENGYG
jgi:hypothetical protein